MAAMASRAFWATGLLVVACGGSEENGLYGQGAGGSAGVAGNPSGGSGGAASGGGGSGGAASGGTASGGTASGGAGGSGGTVPSGGTGGGAGGAGGAPSGGGGAGAAPAGVGTGPCGSATCAFSAGDECCKGDNVPLFCSNEKLSNPCKCSGIACDKLAIACDGPEDCPSGKICCAEKGLVSGSWDVVECRTSCVSEQVGATRREVCHPGGKPCLSGTSCSPDPALPPGYATCAPK